MRFSTKTIAAGLAGFAIAAGLGFAAHGIVGDQIGLSSSGIEAGERLVPIVTEVAGESPPDADTGAAAGTSEVDGQTAEASVPTATGTSGEPAVAAGGEVASALEDGGGNARPDASASEQSNARTRIAAGRRVFASAGCGGCHTLAAAAAGGRDGPDLDELRPSAAEVEAQVRAGGGGMPAFAGSLSERQIRNVALFVARATRPAGSTPAAPTPAPAPTPSPAASDPSAPDPAESPSPAAPPPPNPPSAPAPTPAPPAELDDDSGKGSGSDDDRSGSDDARGGGDDDSSGKGRGRGGDDRDD